MNRKAIPSDMLSSSSFPIQSSSAPLISDHTSSLSAARIPCRPLRVFMYDFPRSFNVAMMDRKSDDDTPVTAQNLPPWPKSSGLRNQHSVEYWLMASLLYTPNATATANATAAENEMEAVRVVDPDSAVVFFVPFFSSLSFNTHGHKMTDPETEIDRQLQVDLLEFLRQSKYWQRSGGRDHVIPMTHTNAFRFCRQQVNASMLVVVDFRRYARTASNLRNNVVSPYVHVVESFVDDDGHDSFESRRTRLFFQGNTVRKDGGKVCAKLVPILAGYDDVIYEKSTATTETIKADDSSFSEVYSRYSKNRNAFIEILSESTRGTPSSCHLFDAIVSHCVPVIVSDRIELPFEDEVDYTQFTVLFSVKEALQLGYMIDQLWNISNDRWMELWTRLKDAARHHEFQYPPKKDDAVNMIWKVVRHKLPEAQLALHRSRRLKIPDWW